MSFDERDAARPGISKLTGETVWTSFRGQPVDHEWGRWRYRWASGACSGSCLQNNVKRDASWWARLAVWCSSLTRGNLWLGSSTWPAFGSAHSAPGPSYQSRVRVRMDAPP